MCRYCYKEFCDEETGEVNQIQNDKYKVGSTVAQIRIVETSKNNSRNVLTIYDSMNTNMSNTIPIDYCPFCGRKL